MSIKRYFFTLSGADDAIDDSSAEVEARTIVGYGSLVVAVVIAGGIHVILSCADIDAMRATDRNNG